MDYTVQNWERLSQEIATFTAQSESAFAEYMTETDTQTKADLLGIYQLQENTVQKLIEQKTALINLEAKKVSQAPLTGVHTPGRSESASSHGMTSHRTHVPASFSF